TPSIAGVDTVEEPDRVGVVEPSERDTTGPRANLGIARGDLHGALHRVGGIVEIGAAVARLGPVEPFLGERRTIDAPRTLRRRTPAHPRHGEDAKTVCYEGSRGAQDAALSSFLSGRSMVRMRSARRSNRPRPGRE